MKQGKTTENGKSLITPNCRNCFWRVRQKCRKFKIQCFVGYWVNFFYEKYKIAKQADLKSKIFQIY